MIDKYQALAAYVKSRANMPFEWGVNDCCIFAADWVREATGHDPMALLRDSYFDEDSAARLIAEKSTDLRTLVTSMLCREPLPAVATAQRGDVILFESGSGPALGICVGEKFAAIRPVGGLGYFSMRHAIASWRID